MDELDCLLVGLRMKVEGFRRPLCFQLICSCLIGDQVTNCQNASQFRVCCQTGWLKYQLDNLVDQLPEFKEVEMSIEKNLRTFINFDHLIFNLLKRRLADQRINLLSQVEDQIRVWKVHSCYHQLSNQAIETKHFYHHPQLPRIDFLDCFTKDRQINCQKVNPTSNPPFFGHLLRHFC